MKQRRRIYYSAAQRSEIWDRWQAGEPMSSIGRRFDRESSSVFSVISPTGGIRPPDRCRAKQSLSLSEREEISRWLSMRCSLRSIARHLGRSPSTISREVQRNGGVDRYRAAGSDQAAWDRARRPKLCKLACRPFLKRTVSCCTSNQGGIPPFELRRKLAFRLQSFHEIHGGSSKYWPTPSTSVGAGRRGCTQDLAELPPALLSFPAILLVQFGGIVPANSFHVDVDVARGGRTVVHVIGVLVHIEH
jgi:hypothetical protein